MRTISAESCGPVAGEVSAHSDRFLITVPDAERLLIQSRFVKNQFEAEILNDLEARIQGATPVDPSVAPPDLVTMNSKVILRDVEAGGQYVFTVVFPSCANSRKGRVSVLTPLGSILLGARTGQTLTCPISGLIATVAVEAILHQPEAAGDFYG